jgi:hypothetical protein
MATFLVVEVGLVVEEGDVMVGVPVPVSKISMQTTFTTPNFKTCVEDAFRLHTMN